MSRRRRSERRGPSPFTWVLIGIGVLGVAAIALTRTGGGPEIVDDATAPVTVDGDALSPFTDGDDTAIGEAAPRVEGTDLDGDPLAIEPGSGPTAVLFLAHWCPHCQAEVDSLNAWLEENEFPEEVDVVSVSTLVDRTRGNYPPKTWLRNWPVPTLVDDAESSVAEAYGLSGTPFWVFIDADGNVVERASGQMEVEELVDRLKELEG